MSVKADIILGYQFESSSLYPSFKFISYLGLGILDLPRTAKWKPKDLISGMDYFTVFSK